jgi:phosphotransferase system HPr (HPr) family protein
LTASIEINVQHKVGLHARPAALFVQAATKFSSEVSVENLTTQSDPINGKSLIRILSVAVLKDHQIRITAEGSDEEEAIEALGKLIAENFGEG